MADQSLAGGASTSPSAAAHRRETWSLGGDPAPSSAATLPASRAGVPAAHVSATAAARARSVRERRPGRPVGKREPLPGLGALGPGVPTVVPGLRLRQPPRPSARLSERAPRSAPHASSARVDMISSGTAAIVVSVMSHRLDALSRNSGDTSPGSGLSWVILLGPAIVSFLSVVSWSDRHPGTGDGLLLPPPIHHDFRRD